MFKILIKFFTILSPLLQRLGACASAGFAAGAIAGFILWVYAFINGVPTLLTTPEIIKISFLLTIAGWLTILFAFVVLARIPFLDIWYSTLFNAFLTSLLTLWVVYKLNLWTIAFLIGIII